MITVSRFISVLAAVISLLSCLACSTYADEFTIDLHNKKINDQQLAILIDSNINTNPNIVAIDLDDTLVTDEGLANLNKLPWLKSIVLNHTRISDAGLVQITGTFGLESLSLMSTQITDTGLSYLQGMPNLKYLDLTNTHISDAGLMYVAQLPQLQGLDLQRTKITGTGLVRIKNLPLRQLWLMNTCVEEKDLVHLTEMTELKFLSLSYMNDSAVSHLAKITSLRTLVIIRCCLTKEGEQKLRQALPNTKMHLIPLVQ